MSAYGVEELEKRVMFTGTPPTFAFPVQYTTGSPVRSVAFGDFNGDGFQDMAVVSTDTNAITIFLNQGNGQFVAQPVIHIMNPLQIVAGNFTGSGHVDLEVLANTVPAHSGNLQGSGKSNDALILLAGNGNGTFTKTLSYKVVAGNHNQMLAADFTGDGLDDVALPTQNGIGILINGGNGTFTSEQRYLLNNPVTDFVTGDFNNDGIADIAASLGGPKVIKVLLGQPDGLFTIAPRMFVNVHPISIAAADFNNDGDEDIVMAGSGFRDGVTVLLGNGDGTFSKGPISVAPAFLRSIIAADFNDDGDADIADVDFATSLRYSLGNGDGTFGPPSAILPGGTEGRLVYSADLTNSGLPDLIYLRHQYVYVFLNETAV
jgi:hypothetical protein